jgi:hypothetical protein
MDDSADTVSLKTLALEEFPRGEPGARECRRIVQNWFDRAAERLGQDTHKYEEEVSDIASVLKDIQMAMSSIASVRNVSADAVDRIWSWPDNPLYSGGAAASRDNSNALERPLAEYLNRPWLQHNLIDASAINALLFEKLAYLSYQMRSGELTGIPNWGAVLGGGNLLAEMVLNLVLPPIRFFLRWLMLPLVAWALISFGYERPAIVTIAIWSLYLLFRLIRTPARWRKRKAARETSDVADKYFHALSNAWVASCGPMINPSRLRELILIAEGCGTALPPILHTIIDRAIQRDPTALLAA